MHYHTPLAHRYIYTHIKSIFARRNSIPRFVKRLVEQESLDWVCAKKWSTRMFVCAKKWSTCMFVKSPVLPRVCSKKWFPDRTDLFANLGKVLPRVCSKKWSTQVCEKACLNRKVLLSMLEKRSTEGGWWKGLFIQESLEYARRKVYREIGEKACRKVLIWVCSKKGLPRGWWKVPSQQESLDLSMLEEMVYTGLRKGLFIQESLDWVCSKKGLPRGLWKVPSKTGKSWPEYV